jgi:hypothetical protein
MLLSEILSLAFSAAAAGLSLAAWLRARRSDSPGAFKRIEKDLEFDRASREVYRRPNIMDPTLLISGVSAALQAVQTWLEFKDSRRAAAKFEERFASAAGDVRVAREAAYLGVLVPADVLDTMIERARKCWEMYHDVLRGGYLPREIDDATDSVKKCICRELRRIRELEGQIPDGELKRWWSQYCVGG